nr:PAS domain S-box protein [Methanocella sp. CWC-04]
MEDDLSRSEERYRLLAENAEDFIFIIDRRLYVKYLNRSAAAALGMGQEEAIDKPLKSLFPGQTFQHMKKGLCTVFGTGRPYKSEHVHDFYTREYWLHVKLAPIFDKHGNVTCVMGISRDITDIKKTEEELRKSEANLLKAQKIARIGSWEWDLRNNRFTWSDEMYNISGIRPGTEISYEMIMSLLNPEYVMYVKNSIDDFLMNGKLTTIEGSMMHPDGTERMIYNECEPVYDDNGHPVRLIGISQDITERKKAEKALVDAKMQAELYVDLMSHDISNMNQISMGFLELALNIMELECNIGEDDRVLLEKSLEAMKNSTKIIDNVKKIQREKNGEYEPEVIDLCNIVEKTISQYSNIPERDINIKYSSDNGSCVLANELLADVFSNIIGNSIKHSTGPINISVKTSLVTEHNKKYCMVIIEDDGPGIHDELKDRLFTRLKKEKGRVSGRGMGLFLVKTLVDDFKGKIFVEDRVPGDHKKGSRFIVMIPAVDP